MCFVNLEKKLWTYPARCPVGSALGGCGIGAYFLHYFGPHTTGVSLDTFPGGSTADPSLKKSLGTSRAMNICSLVILGLNLLFVCFFFLQTMSFCWSQLLAGKRLIPPSGFGLRTCLKLRRWSMSGSCWWVGTGQTGELMNRLGQHFQWHESYSSHVVGGGERANEEQRLSFTSYSCST